MNNFFVRRSSREEIKSFIFELRAKEGWKTGKYDHVFLYDVDPTGYFIGELNGKPISCVAVTKYGSKFAVLSFYMVDKEYRGKGFGLKTFQAGMASLDDKYTCGILATTQTVPLYEKSGFKQTTNYNFQKICNITGSAVAQILTSLPEGVTITLISDVSFDKVAMYESSVFGASSHASLHGILSTPEHYGFVALNEMNDIVGMVLMRRANNESWLVGPLYASNLDIAKCLLKTVLEKCDPNDVVTLQGCLPQFNETAVSLKATTFLDLVVMFTKLPPPDRRPEYMYVAGTYRP